MLMHRLRPLGSHIRPRFSFHDKTRHSTFAPSGMAWSAMGITAASSLLIWTHESRKNTCHLEATNGTTTTTLLNWSGTHSVEIKNDLLLEPESVEQVERIVQDCFQRNLPVRPVGALLSPNGLAFCTRGGALLSLVHLDRIQIDPERGLVTVQAGAKVRDVVEALRPYGWTLPNLASIAEQQMGGLIQVGAHGTGATLAPLDHYVTAMTLVTPSPLGTLHLTKQDGELFEMAKVALGCLGVVVEMTMQCVPAHFLQQHTYVLSREDAVAQIPALLQQHQHVRYMWIPYANAVVVVTNDPVDQQTASANPTPQELAYQHEPLVTLLLQVNAERDGSPLTKKSLAGYGFAELRDMLLAYDPLNVEHVKRCNQAEAEYWHRAAGTQIRPSDHLLQFDCGGQQWVHEVCFRTGTPDKNNGNDAKFMLQLLEGIESKQLPAHAPIEQRWSASSSSSMSPAHGDKDQLHSWVGIINYLPSDDAEQREAITKLFTGPYCDLIRQVGASYQAASHWAKLEIPDDVWKLLDLQLSVANRFPVHAFNKHRAQLDPKNLLANEKLSLLFGAHSR
jgi:L-galactono-1,4-lactone dehydrogenase